MPNMHRYVGDDENDVDESAGSIVYHQVPVNGEFRPERLTQEVVSFPSRIPSTESNRSKASPPPIPYPSFPFNFDVCGLLSCDTLTNGSHHLGFN